MDSEILVHWPFSPSFLPLGVFSNFVCLALCIQEPLAHIDISAIPNDVHNLPHFLQLLLIIFCR